MNGIFELQRVNFSSSSPSFDVQREELFKVKSKRKISAGQRARVCSEEAFLYRVGEYAGSVPRIHSANMPGIHTVCRAYCCIAFFAQRLFCVFSTLCPLTARWSSAFKEMLEVGTELFLPKRVWRMVCVFSFSRPARCRKSIVPFVALFKGPVEPRYCQAHQYRCIVEEAGHTSGVEGSDEALPSVEAVGNRPKRRRRRAYDCEFSNNSRISSGRATSHV